MVSFLSPISSYVTCTPLDVDMNQFPVPTQSSSEALTVLDALAGRFYSCYHEFYRCDRILVDHQAARAFPEVVKDFPQLKDLHLCQRVSQLASVIRTRWIDQAVTDFLTQTPNAIVVNLRSRLCTRYWRLPMLHDDWYEVDNPKIMELRQRYFTIVPRRLDVISDCMDLRWIDKIQRHQDQPLLIIMEGVTLYYSADENQRLFEAIAQKLGPANILFDSVSSNFVAVEGDTMMSQSENFLGERHANFQWGMDDLSAFEGWSLQFKTIQTIHYLLDIANYPERLEPWMMNFWPMLKPLLKKSGQINHLYLG